MNNYFYMNYAEGQDAPMVKHKDKEVAEKEATRLANKLNKKVYVLKSCSMATPDEINIKVDSFEAALEYLGGESEESIQEIEKKIKKATDAIYKLFVIAESWNKADNFAPDFDDENQRKWLPWFRKKCDAGFTCSSSNNAVSFSNTTLGSRFCFKTEDRAEQFGKQFIDLWNEFLL